MQPISEEEFAALGSSELAQRIDTFFFEDHVDRYGRDPTAFAEVKALEILDSTAVQAMPDGERKGALFLFYRSRFQSALCARFGGIENRLIHLPDQRAEKWRSPATQILNAATRPASIVAARSRLSA